MNEFHYSEDTQRYILSCSLMNLIAAETSLGSVPCCCGTLNRQPSSSSRPLTLHSSPPLILPLSSIHLTHVASVLILSPSSAALLSRALFSRHLCVTSLLLFSSYSPVRQIYIEVLQRKKFNFLLPLLLVVAC